MVQIPRYQLILLGGVTILSVLGANWYAYQAQTQAIQALSIKVDRTIDLSTGLHMCERQLQDLTARLNDCQSSYDELGSFYELETGNAYNGLRF